MLGAYDYAGLARASRYRLGSYGLPLVRQRRRPDCLFSKLNTQPTYSPVYASLHTSRRTTQNSGPSGSLLLPRKEFSSSASCRFIPALPDHRFCGPRLFGLVMERSNSCARMGGHSEADDKHTAAFVLFVGAHAGVFVLTRPSAIFRAADETGPHRVKLYVVDLFAVFLPATCLGKNQWQIGQPRPVPKINSSAKIMRKPK